MAKGKKLASNDDVPVDPGGAVEMEGSFKGDSPL